MHNRLTPIQTELLIKSDHSDKLMVQYSKQLSILIKGGKNRMIKLSNSLLDMDATALAKKIKEKIVTSEEVINKHIEHSKKVNPTLNAIVEDRYSLALTEAKNADKQIANNQDVGPLHGVPISIKESFDVKGMKTTGGLIYRENFIAKKHATIVQKLVNAGAIIIGKTNTPILCFCQETDNKLYGRTNNPWDITRTPGGSSGGEGAILGIGGAAAGIGSDIGGSIRVPCHFNGVVGFKSGKHQLSSQGHFPEMEPTLQDRMASMGPMGKSVRDMKLLYEVISKNTLETKSLDNIKVDILSSDIPYPLSEETKKSLNEIDTYLSKMYDTSRSIPPYFEDSAVLWQEIMSIDGGEGVENIAYPNKENVFINYLKEKVTMRTEIHRYFSWALIGSKLFKPSKKRINEIKSIIKEGDETLTSFLESRLLIFPVYHESARKHGGIYKEIFSIKKTFRSYMPYLAYANVWALPSLIIPVGEDENGLPISVQIMGLNINEGLIFQLGKIIEKQFRGYIRSNKLD